MYTAKMWLDKKKSFMTDDLSQIETIYMTRYTFGDFFVPWDSRDSHCRSPKVLGWRNCQPGTFGKPSMRVLASVRDLGPGNNVIAIMANRPHQVPNEHLPWVRVRHDRLNYPLNCSKLNHALAIIGFVPILQKPATSTEVVWPATQSNVQIH